MIINNNNFKNLNLSAKRLSMGIHEMRLLSGGRVGMRGRVGRRMVGVESLNIPTWFQGDLKVGWLVF